MKLSIVVPVYNEADNLELLNRSIISVMNQLQYKGNYEIIYINDGSTDNSSSLLKGIHEQCNNVKVITFRKNFGQTAALDAGFKHASGEIVVTMDADLQNDPHDMPLLLKKLEEGYDVVSGWRFKRNDPLFSKKLPSLLSNWLVKFVSGVKIHDQGCSLKAYKKHCLNDFELYGEMHRFIPLILQLQGYKIGEVKVQHHKRMSGKTKYNLKRLFKGFLDLAYIKFWFNYSSRPLHFFGLLGICSIVIGIVVGILNIAYHMLFSPVSALGVGPILLLSVLLIILGIQFIVMGFLGEIMIRVYYKSQSPPYKIKTILK